MQPRRQVYGAYDRLYVRGVRGKKLNRNPPTPIPHRCRGPLYPSPTPLPSPDARNCIHPIEFLYRGKRTKRELRAYSIWYIMFMCVCVCTICIRSPRTGRLASGVLMKGVVVV